MGLLSCVTFLQEAYQIDSTTKFLFFLLVLEIIKESKALMLAKLKKRRFQASAPPWLSLENILFKALFAFTEDLMTM
jgi:hypothetical protein